MSTSLVTRNVRIGRKRTSVRLEPQLWRALETIAADHHESVNGLCARVAALKPEQGGFTSALRVFIVEQLFQRAFPEDASDADFANAMSPAANGAHAAMAERLAEPEYQNAAAQAGARSKVQGADLVAGAASTPLRGGSDARSWLGGGRDAGL